MLDRDESALHAVQLSLEGRALLDSPQPGRRRHPRPRRASTRCSPSSGPTSSSTPPRSSTCRCSRCTRARRSRPTSAARQTVLDAARPSRRRAASSTSPPTRPPIPTSVLGYTKRIAERLTAARRRPRRRARTSACASATCSAAGARCSPPSGPRSRHGGPVTVTDPDVTRYFMTVEEAVQLVIQAGAIGRDGEALVLDMGEPVRIDDVARRLIAAARTGRSTSSTPACARARSSTRCLFGDGRDRRRQVHPLISHVARSALDRRGAAPARAALPTAALTADLQEIMRSPAGALTPPAGDNGADPDRERVAAARPLHSVPTVRVAFGPRRQAVIAPHRPVAEASASSHGWARRPSGGRPRRGRVRPRPGPARPGDRRRPRPAPNGARCCSASFGPACTPSRSRCASSAPCPTTRADGRLLPDEERLTALGRFLRDRASTSCPSCSTCSGAT